jgi:hypothetical protein
MHSYCSTTLTEVYQCFNTVIYVFLLWGLRILIVQLPWLRFFRAFSSVVRQMPGYNLPSRGTARTLPNFLYCSQILCCVKILCCSMYFLFCVVLCIVCVYMCIVHLPPGGNPLAVNKYIISYSIKTDAPHCVVHVDWTWNNSPGWKISHKCHM